ncbi:MAG TPA: cytochrome c biogenesis protein CcsA [Candidatus Sulfotelmatobacter sp.]|nr:cytochrome c biogenesis protein CcsA [Candidatus Sulfotelmatobacter sp.]
MDFEQSFLYFAILLLFIDLVFVLKTKTNRKQVNWRFWISALAFISIVISYSMFLVAYLTNNFTLKEVYASSSSSLSVSEKIYASWSGAGGSILLLTLSMGVLYFVFRLFTYKKHKLLDLGASKILNVTLLFFLLVAIAKNPFARYESVPIEGQGLNPALQSPWMAIHPPIVFAGYVFVLLAFAITLARMSTQKSGQEKLLRFSTYVAWLLLTIGIALGGVWAYEVLGWGGYWSWDPVETGSLLTWLALTTYFFLDPIVKKGKGLAKEFMILVTFVSLIFLSALTRGGLLQSVHAYALSPAGPILLSFAFAVCLYFFYLQRKLNKPILAVEVDRSLVRSTSSFLAVFSLILMFFVSFFGIAAPIIQGVFMSNVPTPTADFYNYWNFPFVVIFVVSLIGLTLPKGTSMKIFIMLLLASIIVGALLSFFKIPTSNYLSDAGFPILLLALSSISYRIIVSIKQKELVPKLGKLILYTGIILTLIGVLISAGGKQSVQFSNLSADAKVDAVGTNIHFQNFTIYPGTGSIQLEDGTYPEKSMLKIDADIVDNTSAAYSTSIWMELYPAYGIFSKPTIIRTFVGDLYLHIGTTNSTSECLANALFFQPTSPSDFNFFVETMPLIYLVWIGVAVMVFGIVFMLIFKSSISESEVQDN